MNRVNLIYCLKFEKTKSNWISNFSYFRAWQKTEQKLTESTLHINQIEFSWVQLLIFLQALPPYPLCILDHYFGLHFPSLIIQMYSNGNHIFTSRFIVRQILMELFFEWVNYTNILWSLSSFHKTSSRLKHYSNTHLGLVFLLLAWCCDKIAANISSDYGLPH